jgi:hypothetical protein
MTALLRRFYYRWLESPEHAAERLYPYPPLITPEDYAAAEQNEMDELGPPW